MSFAPHFPAEWKLRAHALTLGGGTAVMGIVNVTPDSFSDGGRFSGPEDAVEAALAMFDDGAAIVDIGGESTRPGRREPVSAAEEIGRVLPVIEGILRRRPQSILSIDTYKAETAEAALRSGVEIVNDVSGLTWDQAMAGVCAAAGCGLVLMHTRGRPGEWKELPRLTHEETLPLVKSELRRRLEFALAAGIVREKIVLDPGLGFGKAGGANFPLLAGLGELKNLGRPIVAGASRKSFLGEALARRDPKREYPATARGSASLAAAVIAILAGADLVRTHEVRATVEAAAIADAFLAETPAGSDSQNKPEE